MATFTSSRAGSGDSARFNAVGDVIETIKYTMTLTASATDVVQLCKVLPGARIVGIKQWASAVLSGSMGDGDDTGKFMTTATGILTSSFAGAGSTGSVVPSPIRTINVGAGLGYSYSVADTIDWRFDVAGGLTGTIIYAVVEIAYDQQDTV